MPGLPVAVALKRRLDGGQEQRIVILGDADCISNGELNTRRKDIPAANYGVIVGSFFWMSNDEVPLHITRPPFTDNDIFIGKSGHQITKWAAVGLIPFLMLMGYLLVWIRRRGK